MIDSCLEKGLNYRLLETLLGRRMRGSICERLGIGASEGIAVTIANVGSLLGALVALFCLAILIYIMGKVIEKIERSYMDIVYFVKVCIVIS